MIKTIGFIKRRPELSHAQFIDHWTNVHAEMAKAFPQIHRYHLNYVREEPRRDGMPSWDIRGEIEGIAEIWYDDLQTWQAFRSSPEAIAWRADGAKFIGQVLVLRVEERPFVEFKGTAGVKSIGLLGRKDGLTRQQFADHWRNIHAPMGKNYPQIRRYHINNVVEALTPSDAPSWGLRDSIDGIAEIWFDDQETRKQYGTSPQALEWRADGALFIGRIFPFVVEENIIIA